MDIQDVVAPAPAAEPSNSGRGSDDGRRRRRPQQALSMATRKRRRRQQQALLLASIERLRRQQARLVATRERERERDAKNDQRLRGSFLGIASLKALVELEAARATAEELSRAEEAAAKCTDTGTGNGNGKRPRCVLAFCALVVLLDTSPKPTVLTIYIHQRRMYMSYLSIPFSLLKYSLAFLPALPCDTRSLGPKTAAAGAAAGYGDRDRGGRSRHRCTKEVSDHRPPSTSVHQARGEEPGQARREGAGGTRGETGGEACGLDTCGRAAADSKKGKGKGKSKRRSYCGGESEEEASSSAGLSAQLGTRVSLQGLVGGGEGGAHCFTLCSSKLAATPPPHTSLSPCCLSCLRFRAAVFVPCTAYATAVCNAICAAVRRQKRYSRREGVCAVWGFLTPTQNHSSRCACLR